MHPFYDPIRPPEDEGARKITHKRCYKLVIHVILIRVWRFTCFFSCFWERPILSRSEDFDVSALFVVWLIMQKRPRGNLLYNRCLQLRCIITSLCVLSKIKYSFLAPRKGGGKFEDTQTTTKTHVSVPLISSHVLLDFRCLKSVWKTFRERMFPEA